MILIKVLTIRIKIYLFSICLDCNELHRLLNGSNQDELAIIKILCNRNVGQRLTIRDKYKSLFNQVHRILLNIYFSYKTIFLESW